MKSEDIIKATRNSLNIYAFTAEALEKLIAAIQSEHKCQTCEALARTVMMDQTAYDTQTAAQRQWVGLTDKKTRPATREEKITRPGVYEVPVTQDHQIATPVGGVTMAYEPEELNAIESQHKEGRAMPFVEFPLIGGKSMLRFLRKDGRYVCEMSPVEATSILRSINQACWDAGLTNE